VLGELLRDAAPLGANQHLALPHPATWSMKWGYICVFTPLSCQLRMRAGPGEYIGAGPGIVPATNTVIANPLAWWRWGGSPPERGEPEPALRPGSYRARARTR
jgi:hypothetical protein